MSPNPPTLLSSRFERALRWAAEGHRDQLRKGSGVAYLTHVVAVASALDRSGFTEDVVIAGLLHDLVEDTDATLDEVRERFGPFVAELVGYCSEVKLDASGKKRPWEDRKRDHLAALANAPVEAKGIVLADKLHNLLSIQIDLEEGREVWNLFNASRARVLGYYRASLTACQGDDPRLSRLAGEALAILDSLDRPEMGSWEKTESSED